MAKGSNLGTSILKFGLFQFSKWLHLGKNNKVEVKFLWQILGPPATVTHLGNEILGYLHDTNFNFSINFHFKPKFKGGGGSIVMEKNATSSFWAPSCWSLWEILGLVIGQKWSNLNFLIFSFKNSKLKGGQFKKKNSHHNYLGPILRAVLK